MEAWHLFHKTNQIFEKFSKGIMNFKIFCDMAEFMVQLLVYENASKFEKNLL